jgi:hypothetical protein
MRSVLTSMCAIAAFLIAATAAHAQQRTDTTIYCLVEGGDARSYNCSYRTLEACLASRSGGGGSCAPYRLQKKK